MTERCQCCVPFCKRTTAKPYREWICAEHWRPVPPIFKRLLSRQRKRGDREGFDLTWKTCKRYAIEIAAGVRGQRPPP